MVWPSLPERPRSAEQSGNDHTVSQETFHILTSAVPRQVTSLSQTFTSSAARVDMDKEKLCMAFAKDLDAAVRKGHYRATILHVYRHVGYLSLYT